MLVWLQFRKRGLKVVESKRLYLKSQSSGPSVNQTERHFGESTGWPSKPWLCFPHLMIGKTERHGDVGAGKEKKLLATLTLNPCHFSSALGSLWSLLPVTVVLTFISMPGVPLSACGAWYCLLWTLFHLSRHSPGVLFSFLFFLLNYLFLFSLIFDHQSFFSLG